MGLEPLPLPGGLQQSLIAGRLIQRSRQLVPPQHWPELTAVPVGCLIMASASTIPAHNGCNQTLSKTAHRTDNTLLLTQVMVNPSVVTPDNYAFLHGSGYAGAWGWAWFNVSETFNYTTGAAFRRIGEHECRHNLTRLLASLPPQLRYPVHKLQPPGRVDASEVVAG